MTNIKSFVQYVFGASIIISSLVLAGSPVIASAEMLTRQLQQGMSGADVSLLQTFLAKDATIYPQGLVTGYFGTLTTSAVSNFQARNGIATVGRVGPITLAAINNQMNGDNTSPFIYSVNVNVSNTGANLSWNTDENSSSVLYYGTSPLSMIEGSQTTKVTIGGSSVLVDTNLQSSHSTSLTNLSPNTTYYYIVYVRDSLGNESITWPSTFHTNQ
ncbi:MAG: hypothetical protein AB201_02385 [Parcubacteria bacterium C7867-006]|nr:MAG: hypothetical protein AB201_02385 [Parcubacteria bacterium C7867-006]